MILDDLVKVADANTCRQDINKNNYTPKKMLVVHLYLFHWTVVTNYVFIAATIKFHCAVRLTLFIFTVLISLFVSA